MYKNISELEREVNRISSSVTRDIEKYIRNQLDKCGLYYKCFSRVKSALSVSEKLRKKMKGEDDSYKIQDLIGVRIVVYFKKDILLCEEILRRIFQIDNVSRDKEEDELFCPQRINYVCRMPEMILDYLDAEIWKYPIDKTFEVQIRTIFSEGWHEIEHDFRYKCEDEWQSNHDLSRTLNGVFATLENCDWTIENLLNQLAHRHYKNDDWIPMLKNVFRMRIKDEGDMEEIVKCFDGNREVAKAFLRIDRERFLIKLSEVDSNFPRSLCNIVYLANYFEIKNEEISRLTPNIIMQKCEEYF